jgi:hypothetical protein
MTAPTAPRDAGSAPAETPGDVSPDAPPSDAPPSDRRGRIGRRWWVAGLVTAALVVVVLAPLASADPDGLERVAQDQGFIGLATNFFSGLLGDYSIPGVDNAWLSTVLAGLLGVAIVVAVVFVVGRLVARRRA